MGKNRKSAGGGAGEPIPTEPEIDYSEQNNEVFQEICKEKGVGPKAKQKLIEILEFCNDNNLELTKGITISSPKKDNPWFKYGGTARATIVDKETGKKISIFDDMLKGKNADELSKESLDNLLKGIRYEYEHTNPEFHNLYSDILLTNHRLIQDSGKWVASGGYAFFDPVVPNAITIRSSMLGKQDFTKLGKNSYGHQWNENSVKKMAATIAHENGHAYDYHVIGKGTGTDQPSIFTEHGRNTNTIGPCSYATDVPGETISTVCEMVINRRVRSDANLSDGTSIDDAYHDKYGKWPSSVPSATESKRMYEIWSNDPQWAPLIAEVEGFML